MNLLNRIEAQQKEIKKLQEKLDKATLAWNSACMQRDEMARDKELLNKMVYKLAKKIKEGCGWSRPTEEQIEDEIRWVKEEIEEDDL